MGTTNVFSSVAGLSAAAMLLAQLSPPLPAQQPAAIARPAVTARFTPEAQGLLYIMSAPYAIGQKRVVPTGDTAFLHRCLQSDDERIRTIAAEWSFVTEFVNPLQSKPPVDQAKEMADCVKKWTSLIGKDASRVLAGQYRPEAGADDDQRLKDFANDFIADAQKAANQQWALRVIRMTALNSAKEKLRQLAEGNGATVPNVPGAISAELSFISPNEAVLTIVNRTVRELHHCMIQSRAIPNLEKARERTTQELVIGTPLAMMLGANGTVMKNAAASTILMGIAASQEYGVTTYVPVVPPGATLTIGMATTDFRFTKRIEACLFCDEFTANPIPVAMPAPAEAAPRANPNAPTGRSPFDQSKGFYPTRPGATPYRNPLDEPARRVR